MGIGYFITFEGIEGCGKSTQIKKLAAFLRKQKIAVKILREPGGTKISEKIRQILLDKKNNMMTAETELLLYCAARSQITNEIIQRELDQGTVVLCDRFYDSTVAYQGYGLEMNLTFVKRLCSFATNRLKPNVTFLLDIPIKIGLKRAGNTDRIEARSLSYHQKVKKGFLEIASKEKRRFSVLNANRSIEAIAEDIENIMIQKLKLKTRS